MPICPLYVPPCVCPSVRAPISPLHPPPHCQAPTIREWGELIADGVLDVSDDVAGAAHAAVGAIVARTLEPDAEPGPASFLQGQMAATAVRRMLLVLTPVLRRGAGLSSLAQVGGLPQTALFCSWLLVRADQTLNPTTMCDGLPCHRTRQG
jgi:hypothetical protein